MNYWEPGWTGKLSDGTEVRCVHENDIPKEMWKHAAGSMWAVGKYENGKLVYHDRIPTSAWHTGAIKQDGSHKWSVPSISGWTCLVPVKFLHLAENEWGPVTP